MLHLRNWTFFMHSYSCSHWSELERERKCDVCSRLPSGLPILLRFIRDLGWCVHIAKWEYYSVSQILSDPDLKNGWCLIKSSGAYSLYVYLKPALRAELIDFTYRSRQSVPIASWSPCGRASPNCCPITTRT